MVRGVCLPRRFISGRISDQEGCVEDVPVHRVRPSALREERDTCGRKRESSVCSDGGVEDRRNDDQLLYPAVVWPVGGDGIGIHTAYDLQLAAERRHGSECDRRIVVAAIATGNIPLRWFTARHFRHQAVVENHGEPRVRHKKEHEQNPPEGSDMFALEHLGTDVLNNSASHLSSPHCGNSTESACPAGRRPFAESQYPDDYPRISKLQGIDWEFGTYGRSEHVELVQCREFNTDEEAAVAALTCKGGFLQRSSAKPLLFCVDFVVDIGLVLAHISATHCCAWWLPQPLGRRPGPCFSPSALRPSPTTYRLEIPGFYRLFNVLPSFSHSSLFCVAPVCPPEQIN